MRTVRCATPGCPSAGLVRTVPDRRAAPGVVYRPTLFCADCDAALPDLERGGTAIETTVAGPPETRARKAKQTATKRAR